MTRPVKHQKKQKDVEAHLISLLKPEQQELVALRKQHCEPCSQNRQLNAVSVQCEACGCAGVSLMHGRCKLRKWPVVKDEGGEAMPTAPPPKPTPPDWMRRPPTPIESHRTPSNSIEGGKTISDLFIYGFPGLYAGANTELHHQIILWRMMGLHVHLIPEDTGFRKEPLFPEMMDQGVIIHEANQFEAITPGSPVLGFCNDRYLARIDEILLYSHNTVFLNCMTWLFEQEKLRHREGKIAAFLYQNENVRLKNRQLLREINPDPDVQYLTFKPYFDSKAFPFNERSSGKGNQYEYFTIGRISRQDEDKFSANTVKIWEQIDSPVSKRGVMLGFGPDSKRKLGGLSDHFRGWVQTYTNQTELSQQDFYKQVAVIVQPMDMTENWPRIGLEAMASGCVLIVDNRGGWQQMIEHGKTGWLCNKPEDFIRYATRMAHNPEERSAIADAAHQRLMDLSGTTASASSWSSVLDQLGFSTSVDQEVLHA